MFIETSYDIGPFHYRCMLHAGGGRAETVSLGLETLYWKALEPDEAPMTTPQVRVLIIRLMRKWRKEVVHSENHDEVE